jgi:hypothetical protein
MGAAMMGFWWVWPPFSGSVDTTLHANAGPAQSAFLGVPIALAGSASGGTAPYSFAWSVFSAPVGGVATFMDATDPTSDVTFSVAEGNYRLLLTAFDVDGAIAFSSVVMVAVVARFLDTLDVQPSQAFWDAGWLRAAYVGATIRVERSGDNAQQDFTPDVGTGLIDTVALVSWVTQAGADPTADGEVVTRYNQAVGASPASLTGSGAFVVLNGVAQIGGTGFLCTRFGAASTGAYAGLGGALVGDVGVTILFDAAPDVIVPPGSFLSAVGFAHSAADWDWAGVCDFHISSDYSDGAIWSGAANAYVYSAPDGNFPGTPGWFQASRSAGQSMDDCKMYWNAVLLTPHYTPDPTVPTFAGDRFLWSAAPGASASVAVSFAFGIHEDLTANAHDQALYDAWALAHHA